MNRRIKLIAIGSLAVLAALLLSACGVVQRPAISQPTAAPSYGYGPGIPFLNLPGNTTQTVTWTAPTTAGTYTVLCTLHPGMSLTITVKNRF